MATLLDRLAQKVADFIAGVEEGAFVPDVKAVRTGPAAAAARQARDRATTRR